MPQPGRREEIKELGPETTPSLAGKMRHLRLEEAGPSTRATPFMDTLTVESAQLNLRPGDIPAYVAQKSPDGAIRGWVEAKRTANEMEDSITVSARDYMRKRQAR